MKTDNKKIQKNHKNQNHATTKIITKKYKENNKRKNYYPCQHCKIIKNTFPKIN